MDPSNIVNEIVSDLIDTILKVHKYGASEINLQNDFDSSELTTNETIVDDSEDECELIVPQMGVQDSVSDSTANEISLDEEEHSKNILNMREDEEKDIKLNEACETAMKAVDVGEIVLCEATGTNFDEASDSAKKDADASEIVSGVREDEPIPCEDGSSEAMQNAFDSSEVTTCKATFDVSEDACVPTIGAQDSLDSCDSTANEISLDEEEPNKIVSDACEDDEAKEIKLMETNETNFDEASETVQKDGDAGEIILDEPSDEANGIILQILETAYNAVNASEATSEITLVASEDQASHVLEIDKTNEMETRSLSDAENKSSDPESDTSLIVESIDCFYDNEIDRDVRIVESSHFERSEPNALMSPPPAVIAQTCETEDRNDKQRVNEFPDIGLDGQKTIVVTEDGISATVAGGAGATNNLSQLLANDAFYSNEKLRRKGYDIRHKSTVKHLLNLALRADTSHKSTAFCSGFPPDISPNQLVPLFEKFGHVFELIVVLDTGVVNVTYLTDKECETAIEALNGRKIQGKPIKVEKYCTKTRLHVRPISIDAQKLELIVKFNKLTKGLVSVFLPYSLEHESRNRGFCYLDYNSFESAKEAKKILSNMNYNGHKVSCDWATVQPDHWKVRDKAIESKWRKVFMNNLRPGLTAANLRTLFSVYGEVTEIDKSENWASVKFHHRDSAKRAVLNIDRKLLGNRSVQISLDQLKNTSSETPANSGDYKRKRLETSSATCSESRTSISTVNKNSFGAARNERQESPKRGSNERFGYPQSPKRGFGDRQNIRNGSGNRHNDNKSSKHGSSQRYGNSITSSTLGPATSTCDDNSTPNNGRCGAIDANATTMNKPGKNISKIFFL